MSKRVPYYKGIITGEPRGRENPSCALYFLMFTCEDINGVS